MNLRKLIPPAVIIAIILSLIGIVYNGLCKDIEKIEKKQEQKVDNETLKQFMIQQSVIMNKNQELMQIQIENSKKDLERLYQEVKDIKKGGTQ